MTRALWGGVENREPDKSELVWLSAGHVYSQNGGRVEINPIFQLETTRQILLDARIKMDKLGL